MRTLLRVSTAAALAYLGLVGPVSAATKPETVAQAPPPPRPSRSAVSVTDSRGAPLSGAHRSRRGRRAVVPRDDRERRIVLAEPAARRLHGHREPRRLPDARRTTWPSSPGTPAAISVTMQELNLSSLRVIGRTGTTVNRTPFNVSESSISTLPPLEITLRQNNNLTDTLATFRACSPRARSRPRRTRASSCAAAPFRRASRSTAIPSAPASRDSGTPTTRSPESSRTSRSSKGAGSQRRDRRRVGRRHGQHSHARLHAQQLGGAAARHRQLRGRHLQRVRRRQLPQGQQAPA